MPYISQGILYWTITFFGLTEERVITSTIIVGIEIVFEITQFKSSGWKYFMNLNNLFDIFIVFCHIAFVHHYYDHYLEHQEVLSEIDDTSVDQNKANTSQFLTMAAFAGIWRSVSTIFRQFKETRFLTYMISESITDLKPFI